MIRSSIWLANTTVSFGVAAHAAGMNEVNGNTVADAIKVRLFSMLVSLFFAVPIR